MFTGIGTYYLKKKDKLQPICLSGFDLTPNTQTQANSYKDWSSRITYKKRENQVVDSWTLTLTNKTPNLELYASSLFSETLDTPFVKELSVWDGTSEVLEPFWNLTEGRLNAELKVNDKYYKVDSLSETYYNIDSLEAVFGEYSFKGVIYVMGEPKFFITIDQMYRKDTSTLSPVRDVDYIFEVIEPRIWNAGEADKLQGFVVFAAVPEEYSPNSNIILAGQVIVTNNPNNIPIDQLNLEARFDFAEPGTEIKSFKTDKNGIFDIEYEVDPNLTFPKTGKLVIIDKDSGSVLFEQDTKVKEPATPRFTASITGGDAQFSTITVSGKSKPGSTVSLSSNGLNGLFNNVTLPVRLDGSWTTSGRLPDSVEVGDSYSIAASSPGFNNIILNNSVSIDYEFNPLLTYTSNQYKTGTPITLLNLGTVRPNQKITVNASTDTTTIVDTTITSSTDGSFSLPFTIPISEQGKQITWTFTELLTNDSKVLTTTAPAFNKTTQLSLNDSQNSLVAGRSRLTGNFTVSPGYDVTVKLKDSSNKVVGSTFYQNVTQPNTSFNVQISPEAQAGNFSLEAAAAIHDTAVINPVPFTIKEAVTIEQPSGLLYPNRVFTLTGKGPANKPLTLNVFGNTYSTNVSNDKKWSIELTVPTAEQEYEAVAVSDGVSANTKLVVKSVSLIVNGCRTGTYYTGSQDNFGSFSGTLLPTKTLTITFTGIPLEPIKIKPTSDGTWNIDFNVPWQPSGSWSAVFTAPGETTFTCSGTHEPELRFFPGSLTLKQGDEDNSVKVRGKANSSYPYRITGPLEDSGIAFTNGVGFATINLKDVPLFTRAVSTGGIIVEDKTLTYSIQPKVPITVDVSNPSVIANGQKVLFTEETFNVVGAIPKNGVYSLASIGSTESFKLTQVTDQNRYSAILETSNEPGSARVTVATIFQDAISKEFIVSPPLTYTIPDSLISNSSYPITISSLENELVELKITGDLDGVIAQETARVDSSGTFTYNFNTTGVTENQVLTFSVKNQYFTHTPQNRNIGGFTSGIPEPLFTGINSSFEQAKYNQYSIQSSTFGSDNSPINEAGKLNELTSGLSIFWSLPEKHHYLKTYLIEEYSNGKWAKVGTTKDTKFIPQTKNKNYRITALHSTMVSGEPVRASIDEDTILAKSVIFTALNSSYENNVIIDKPAISSFYTFTTETLYEDDLNTGLYSSSIINKVQPNEQRSFYIVLVTKDYTDSIGTSLNSSSDLVTVNLEAPEKQPFFTL